MARIEHPIEFQPKSGRTAYGFEATLLPDLCDLILQCRDAGLLVTSFQRQYAKQADILMRAFAKVGIIALITTYFYDIAIFFIDFPSLKKSFLVHISLHSTTCL